MKIDEYLKSIKMYLKREPELSKEITEHLMNEFKITRANARKVLSILVRDKKLVRFERMVFDSGSYLIYKTMNEDYFLKKSLKLKPYLSLILKELDENRVISNYRIAKYSAASLDDSSSKRTLKMVVEEIKCYRKVKYFNNHIVYNALTEDECISTINEYKKHDIFNLRLISSVVNYHLHMNVITNQTMLYRSKQFELPKYIDNVFDIIGTSLSLAGKNENCKCLYEVNATNIVTLDEVKYFIERIENVRNNKSNKHRIMPIIVYLAIREEALLEAKKNGVILFDVNKVFGCRMKEIYSLLDACDNNEYDINNIATVLEVIRQSGQDINLGNLKGELFERIVVEIVSCIYNSQGIRIKRNCLEKEINREIDIEIDNDKPNEVVLVECKSSSSKILLGYYNEKTGKITNDSVKYFYDTLSKYREKINDNGKFCFFAANGFEKKAIDKMQKYSPTLKPSKLDFYYDYNRVKEELLPQSLDIQKELECWKKYFLNARKMLKLIF